MQTVLVVDDNDSIRRGLSLVLRRCGFRAFAVADGAEAVLVAGSVRPDLILLDQAMPGVDGLGTLRQLRSLPGWAVVPVVVYSASADPGVRREAERLGAAFVSKAAASWEDLVSRIRRELPNPRVADVDEIDEITGPWRTTDRGGPETERAEAAPAQA